MNTLVIGGDRIETIRRELTEFGVRNVEHWSGRKPADTRREIPSRVSLVVMLTDQLSHALLYNATIKATRLGLPILYSTRSARELRDKLVEHFGKKTPRHSILRVGSGWSIPINSFAISY